MCPSVCPSSSPFLIVLSILNLFTTTDDHETIISIAFRHTRAKNDIIAVDKELGMIFTVCTQNKKIVNLLKSCNAVIPKLGAADL